MNKTFLILRQEIITLICRRSFWISILVLPLFVLALYGGLIWINMTQVSDNANGDLPPAAQALLNPPVDSRPSGFVDLDGLVSAYPADFPLDRLIPYGSRPAAQQALDDGRIRAYYVIPTGYIKDGRLQVYTAEYNLKTSTNLDEYLDQLITYNLLKGDSQAIDDTTHVLEDIEMVNLSPTPDRPAFDPSSLSALLVPYGMMMFMFLTIMGTSTLLINSLNKEKENRVIETLLMSASPHQFLTGKIIGLGLVGLMQVGLWGVGGLVIMRLGGQSTILPVELNNVGPTLLGWAVVFFLPGYLIYASLMAGVGALTPDLREASQMTLLVTVPMFAPMFLLSVLMRSPNGPVSVGLSLFPLTAPTTMMLRLASGPVPFWQIALSLVLLVAADYLVIRLVARLFRAQTILAGQGIKGWARQLLRRLSGKKQAA